MGDIKTHYPDQKEQKLNLVLFYEREVNNESRQNIIERLLDKYVNENWEQVSLWLKNNIDTFSK